MKTIHRHWASSVFLPESHSFINPFIHDHVHEIENLKLSLLTLMEHGIQAFSLSSRLSENDYEKVK